MTKKSSPATPLDLTIARRAIGLTTGMSGSAHVVGFALMEHYNRKTGQCDPSIARLAVMLGISEATVKRATKELCDEYGLFRKSSHGGLSHRAKYQPNWKTMRGILASWEARMPTGSPPENAPDDESNVSEMSCSTAQYRSLEQLNIEPRTLLNKPYGINPSSDGASGGVQAGPVQSAGDQAARAPQADRLAGLWKGQPEQVQIQPSEVAYGGRSRVAQQAAMRRWHSAMMRRGRGTFARFIEWATEEISDKATAAEMRRQGDGERFIVDRMNAAGLVTRDG